MVKIPDSVKEAWEMREGPIVLATVNNDRVPNAIYATCVSRFSEDTIIVADNYFDKTLNNILTGSKGSVLFITKEGKSYQIKGSIEYHKEGVVYDDMKKWNPSKHPGRGAAAIKVEEVYQGAKKIL